MAAVCQICGKKPFFGMQVSHSHRRSPKRWDPNIQRVRAMVALARELLHDNAEHIAACARVDGAGC